MQYFNLKFKLLFLTLLFVGVLSCRKNELGESHSTLLNEAHEWYDKQVSYTENPKLKAYEPKWEEAKIISVDGSQAIAVPLPELKISNPKFDLVRAYLFSFSKGKVTEGKIVEIVGEKSFIETRGIKLLSNYKEQAIAGLDKGAVFIYDIFHQLKDSRSFDKGILTKDKARLGQENPIGQSTKQVNNYPETPESNCTDWYWVTYNTQTGEIYNATYLYTQCEDGSTNTSGGSTDDPVEGTSVLKTDCESFSFSQTTTANWQEAGVNQIRLKWVWIGGNNNGMTRELYVNHVVFGYPKVYTNSNGTTTPLSAGEAATRAAKAVEAAKLDTYREFRDSPYTPQDAQVSNYFINKCQYYMSINMGTAGTTGSGSSNIVFNNEERSNWSDPYDCS